MRNPQFIKSLAVERKSQVQNKIFLFFMEDNIENRTMEQTVPMIAQMCKEENGSEKPDSRNMFSTALKTRLICGNQEEGQYYPFMKDIFFLESQDLIYGLFTNAWNHSAVCSYKVEDVELVFNTSDLLGSSRKDLKIRPGTCLPGSKRTPPETTDEAAKYPFLTSWVWPLGNQTVFQNLYHYKKLVVDEIKAADMQTYKVIILATAPPDNGSLHKVVEYDDGASNILELHPFKKTSNETNDILYLELDPSKADHVLYVGSANEVARVPLDDCSAYNNTCTSCLLARDPFCGWAEGKCQSILMKDSMKIIQNLTAGAMCYYEQGTTPEYQRVGSYRRPSNNNNVQPPSTYFLTCLAESEQATYWWEDGNGFKQSCTPNEGKCHLLFNKFGEYRCMAQEFSTKYIVSKYSYSMENSSARTQYSCIVHSHCTNCGLMVHARNTNANTKPDFGHHILQSELTYEDALLFLWTLRSFSSIKKASIRYSFDS
ncbi:semaphorin-7A [Gastrophryne carolinensis]